MTSLIIDVFAAFYNLGGQARTNSVEAYLGLVYNSPSLTEGGEK